MRSTPRPIALAIALAGLTLVPALAQESGSRQPKEQTTTSDDAQKNQDTQKKKDTQQAQPQQQQSPRSGNWGNVIGQAPPPQEPQKKKADQQPPQQQPKTQQPVVPQPRWQQPSQPQPQPQPETRRPDTRWQQPSQPQQRERQPQYAEPRSQSPQDWLNQLLPQFNGTPPQVSRERQQQLIDQQRERASQYDQRLQRQSRTLERRGTMLQRQHRSSQYRYHQRYLDRLHEQQRALRRSHDFRHDPFFYTGPTYWYFRGGHRYSINSYAARVLQDAVNYGYEQGYLAGEADREDGWRFDCENSFAYLDANYGYEGFYVAQDDYNFYFREGFRRGYEDGYYGRYRYGVYDDEGLHILGDVLRVIIDLQALR